MSREFGNYATYFFDCDGVLLDSNRVKSNAFYEAVLHYGVDEANEFLGYHKSHGGISRQEKFAYFFTRILGYAELPEAEYHRTLSDYSRCVEAGLAECKLAPGVKHALDKTPSTASRFVVSGGAEQEVRWALRMKGISDYFREIYGNPQDKIELVSRARGDFPWQEPALFIGDARYDHVVAAHYDMDFLFVSTLSEFAQWPEYVEQHNLSVVSSLADV